MNYRDPLIVTPTYPRTKFELMKYGCDPKDARSPNRTSSAVAFALLALAVLAVAQPALAHHSLPVNFDQSKEITITRTLTEIKWVNPHSRFRVNVAGDDGRTVEWLVEMGAINTMKRAGFDIERFNVGETLTIIGSPGRGRERTMLLRTAVLKDGTRLSP